MICSAVALQLRLALVMITISSASSAIHNVTWTAAGLSQINNVVNVSVNDEIHLHCYPGIPPVSYSLSESDFNNCNLGAFTALAVCQHNQETIFIVIVPSAFGIQYTAGNSYYYTSTSGTDCTDGLKMRVNVVQIVTTTATATTAAVTATTTAAGVAGTVSNSVASSTTGASATSTAAAEVTPGATTVSPTATTGSSEPGLTVTPTEGGTNEENGGSFLNSLPFNGAAVLPAVVGGLLVIILVLVLAVAGMACFYKHSHQMKKDLVLERLESDDSTKILYSKSGNEFPDGGSAGTKETQMFIEDYENVEKPKSNPHMNGSNIEKPKSNPHMNGSSGPTQNKQPASKLPSAPPAPNRSAPNPPTNRVIASHTNGIKASPNNRVGPSSYKPAKTVAAGSYKDPAGPSSLPARPKPPPPPTSRLNYSQKNGPSSLASAHEGVASPKRQAPAPPVSSSFQHQNRQKLPPL